MIVVTRDTPEGTIPESAFLMHLVALSKMNVPGASETPIETIEGETGSLGLVVYRQNADGSRTSQTPGGWNRVRNISVTEFARFMRKVR